MVACPLASFRACAFPRAGGRPGSPLPFLAGRQRTGAHTLHEFRRSRKNWPDQNAVSLTSTIFSPALRRVAAVGHAFTSIDFNLSFDVFPQVTHRTCGGVPNSITRLARSRSFVSTIAFASRAEKKMSRSLASRNLKSLTATASTPYVALSHWAITGESCASTQIFTPQGWDD